MIDKARNEYVKVASVGNPGVACKHRWTCSNRRRGDLIDEIDEVITVGEFYEKAVGGQIIFT